MLAITREEMGFNDVENPLTLQEHRRTTGSPSGLE